MEICKGEGSFTGPLFVGHKVKRMSGVEMDLLFHALLLEVQRRFTKVLPELVNEKSLSQPMNGIRVCGQTIVETSAYTTVRRALPVQ